MEDKVLRGDNISLSERIDSSSLELVFPFLCFLTPALKYTHKLKMMIYSKFFTVPNSKGNYDLGRDEEVADLKLMKIVVKKQIYFYEDLAFQFLEIVYPYLTGHTFVEEPYEKGQVSLEKGGVVIDVGANLGIFSIFASKRIGEMGKVYAFEPVSITSGLLIKTVKINTARNVEVIPCALGKSNEDLIMSLSRSLERSSGFFELGEEKVAQITLDEFLAKNSVQIVDFIKADIEGMEREMPLGAKNTIRKFKPKLSICIYHCPDDPKDYKKTHLFVCT